MEGNSPNSLGDGHPKGRFQFSTSIPIFDLLSTTLMDILIPSIGVLGVGMRDSVIKRVVYSFGKRWNIYSRE